MATPGTAPPLKNSGNSRNGKSRKFVRSVHGAMDLDVPRDRNGSFEPKLVKKGEKQLHGFDDRIISLRGGPHCQYLKKAMAMLR